MIMEPEEETGGSVRREVAHLPVQKCLAGEEISNLSDQELLAVVLGTGLRGRDAMGVAMEALNAYGGLCGIHGAGLRELARHEGIGLKKALRIHAALEMGRRIIADRSLIEKLDSPREVWRLLLPEMALLRREEFRVLILNNKNRLLKKSIVSVGTVSEAVIHPREIFRDAIREAASSVIVAHNHPSGVLTPSREDITATTRLREAGKIIGIEVLDHVIIGDTGYLSLREAGYM